MIARINATGTHVRNNVLYIRVDLIPEPSDSSYAIYHVEVPDMTGQLYPGELDSMGDPVDFAAFEAWIASLPKVWVTNPCVCHFLSVDPGMTFNQLRSALRNLFKAADAAMIDSIMSEADTITRIGDYMRPKKGKGAPITGPVDFQALIESVNTKYNGREFAL